MPSKSSIQYFAGTGLKLGKSSKFSDLFQASHHLTKSQVLKEGGKFIFYGGFTRWILMALLPFIVLALISSQIRQSASTETIHVPKNFCEIDARETCTEGKCIRFDPKKFQHAPSVMTYFPGGRLGNMITAYLTLTWMKEEFGYDVYYEKESFLVNILFESAFSIPQMRCKREYLNQTENHCFFRLKKALKIDLGL